MLNKVRVAKFLNHLIVKISTKLKKTKKELFLLCVDSKTHYPSPRGIPSSHNGGHYFFLYQVCYGLSVCGPQNSYVGALTLSVMVLGGRAFGEVIRYR